MKYIKYRTIANLNIQKLNGYYCFVNNIDKLITTGFKTKEKLLEYKNNIS